MFSLMKMFYDLFGPSTIRHEFWPPADTATTIADVL